MVAGVGNPRDVTHSTTTRPTRVSGGVNQRRYFSAALKTQVWDQDFNDLWEQIRYAGDFYGIPDVEGDDTILQQAIAAGATSLSGNLAAFQAVTASADKIAYFSGGSSMATFTATLFSRGLMSNVSAAQWRDALGISAVFSDNVTAFAALASVADRLPYFTGAGTMSMVTFTAFVRTLMDDADAATFRATLGFGSAVPSAFFNTLIDDADAATARGTLGITAVAASGSASDLTTGTLPSARLPASLASIYALTPAADRLPYYSGASTAALATFTAFGRSLVDDADAAAGRTTLGLAAIAASGSASDLIMGLLPDGRLPNSLLTIYALSPATDRLPYYTGPISANLAVFTAFARTILDDADAATVRATISAQALSSELSAIAGLISATDRVPYFTGVGTAALATFTAFARSLLDDVDATTARATLAAAALASPAFTGTPTAPTAVGGTNTTQIATTAFVVDAIATGAGTYQPLDNELTALSGVTAAADRLPYFSGASTAALATFTAFGRSLVDDADATAGRATLGLALVASSASATDLTAGTLPSARLPAALASIYALTPAADRLPYYTSALAAALATFTAFARTLLDDADASAARTTLGLAAIAASGDAADLTGTLAAARLPNSLAAIYALTPAANKVPYYTSASLAGLTDFTAYGRGLVGVADDVNARGYLGLATAAATGDFADMTGKVLFEQLAMGDTTNLLNNGNLELLDGVGNAYGWTTTDFTFASGVNAYNGNGYATVNYTGVSSNKILTSTSTVECQENQKFYIDCWVKTGSGYTTDGVGLRLDARWLDKDGVLISTSPTNALATVSTTYVQLSAVIIAPAGSVSLKVRFLSYGHTAGTIYVDAFRIRRMVSAVLLPDSLASIYVLTPAADRLPYYTSASAAALATFTAFGRSLVDDADATAGRATLGLGTMATQNAGAVAITGGTISGITNLAVADGGTGASTASVARTNLGLAIGSDVVAYSARLQSITDDLAAASGTIEKVSASVFGTYTVTAFAKTVLDDTTAGAVRTTLGLAAVASSGDAADLTGNLASGRLPNSLSSIFALTPAADRLPYYTSASAAALATFTAFARTLLDDADAATARTTLGAAPTASPTFTGTVTVPGLVSSDIITLNSAGLELESPSGVLAQLKWMTGGSQRWGHRKSTTAESGANVGSDLQLFAYDDSGVSLGTVYTASRATRILAFALSPTAPTPAAADSTTKLATTAYVQGELASFQPLATSLSAIGALTPAADRLPYYTSASVAALATFTAFARTLLDDATASAARTTLALGTIATQDANSVAITGGTISGITDLLVADGGTGASNGLNARANLGLAIGSDVQAQSARLQDIADNLTATSGTVEKTAAGTFGTYTVTTAAKTVLDDTTVGAMRTTLGLAAIAASGDAADLTGTLASARLPNSLSAIYALTPAADRLPYYTSASAAALATFTAFGRSLVDDADAAAGRTTLGLGTIATLASTAKVDTAGDTMTGSLVLNADAAITVNIRRYSTNVTPPELIFRKARGTLASSTVVATNDQMGQVTYGYYDGAAFQDAVFLRATVIAGTPSATDGEARLVGLVNAAGSVAPSELFRFDHAAGFSMYGANPVIDANRVLRNRAFTVATLPTAVAGMIAYVTDSTITTRQAAPVGGGANRVMVYADNIGWKIF
jgi:hypothetical protein